SGRGSNSARCPFQRTYSFGSVRRRKTVSGAAAMVMVRSMTSVSTLTFPSLLPLGLLRGHLQRVQGGVPVGFEDRAQLSERLGKRLVQAPSAVTSLTHESRLSQHAQVLRDRRTGHVEALGDLAGAALLRPHQAEDLPAPGLRDRPQLRVHAA